MTGRYCQPCTVRSSPFLLAVLRAGQCRPHSVDEDVEATARGGKVAELGLNESGAKACLLSPGAFCSSEVDFVPLLLWWWGGAIP